MNRLKNIFVSISSIWDNNNINVLRLDIIAKIFKKAERIRCSETGKIDSLYLSSLLSVFQQINKINHLRLKQVKFQDATILCSDLVFNNFKSSLFEQNWTIQEQEYKTFQIYR